MIRLGALNHKHSKNKAKGIANIFCDNNCSHISRAATAKAVITNDTFIFVYVYVCVCVCVNVLNRKSSWQFQFIICDHNVSLETTAYCIVSLRLLALYLTLILFKHNTEASLYLQNTKTTNPPKKKK